MKDNEKVKIQLILTNNELSIINEQAKVCDLSRNEYIRQQALNGTVTSYLTYARAMCAVCILNNLADTMDDPSVKMRIRKEADALWFALKSCV